LFKNPNVAPEDCVKPLIIAKRWGLPPLEPRGKQTIIGGAHGLRAPKLSGELALKSPKFFGRRRNCGNSGQMYPRPFLGGISNPAKGEKCGLPKIIGRKYSRKLNFEKGNSQPEITGKY